MFVWCDLSAWRAAEARAFYARVLGWTYTNEDYAMAMSGADPVGAIFDMPAKFRDMGMPSFWMSYIGVASVSETVERARALGARIEVEAPFGDGHIALIRDPLGAGFTVYQGDMPPGAMGTGPGLRAGHALMVSDAGIARFYEQLFGWHCHAEAGGWRFADRGAPIAEMHALSDAQRSGYEFWAIAFSVADLDRAAAAIRDNGGSVDARTDLMIGRALAARDMDGAAFFLTEA